MGLEEMRRYFDRVLEHLHDVAAVLAVFGSTPPARGGRTGVDQRNARPVTRDHIARRGNQGLMDVPAQHDIHLHVLDLLEDLPPAR